MKTIEFENRYFANNNEWEWFLSQIDVKNNNKNKVINKIILTIDINNIEIEYTDL